MHRFTWTPLILFALVAAAPASPDGWPVELTPAMRAYESGDMEEARRLLQQVRARPRSPDRASYVEALEAMILLASPARADQLDGQARLALLTDEHPHLAQLPECQLSFGLAQLSLNATSDAIRHLSAAADAFEGRSDCRELLESALGGLARAWAIHAEWDTTPPEARVLRPSGAAEAFRTRLQQVSAVRERAQRAAVSTVQIDESLVRLLLNQGRTDEALEIGLRIAADVNGTGVAIDLVRAFEEAAAHEAATRVLDALAASGRPDAATAAAVERSRRSVASLDVEAVPAGADRPLTLSLRARHVPAVQVELRRVDLVSWLESRQGRLDEQALPKEGAVAFAHVHESAVAEWQTELELAGLPPGAYAAVVFPAGSPGSPLTVSRLVVSTGLMGVVGVRPDSIAAWATWTDGASRSDAAPTEFLFWMHGSFVPTRVQADAYVVFPMPAEARVLRDKRWVCVVRRGEHLALCRGSLGEQLASGRILLHASEVRAASQNVIRVTGALLDRLSADSLTIDLVDVRGARVARAMAHPDASGLFTLDLAIDSHTAGQVLRVLARDSERLLTNVMDRTHVAVESADAADVRLVCEMPAQVPGDATRIPGALFAQAAGGAPLAGAEVHCILRALRLTPTGAPERSKPTVRRGQLDRNGRFDFTVDPKEFRLPEGPLLIGVWVQVRGWDGRESRIHHNLLVSDEPAFTWLAAGPPSSDWVQLQVGLADPAFNVVGPLALHIDRADRSSWPLGWTRAGLRSAPIWLGETLTAEMLANTRSGDVVRRAATVESIDKDAPPSEPMPWARWSDPDAAKVDFRLPGRPELVLLDDGWRLAVPERVSRFGEFFAGQVALAHRPYSARLHSIGLAADGASLEQRSLGVAPCPTPGFALNARLTDEPPLPGQLARVRIDLTDAGDAPISAIVRVTPVDADDRLQWAPTSASVLAIVPPLELSVSAAIRDFTPLAIAGNSHEPRDRRLTGRPAAAGVPSAAAPKIEPISVFVDEPLGELVRGRTLWSAKVELRSGSAELNIPAPSEEGRFAVRIFARAADGRQAAARLDLPPAQRGPWVKLPHWLQVGDRLRIQMDAPSENEAAAGALRFETHGGLRLETPSAERAGGAPVRPATRLVVEAVAAGPARLDVWRGAALVSSTECMVAESLPVQNARIHVRRTLMRVTVHSRPAYETDPNAPTPVPIEEEVELTPLQPGGRVRLGEVLLVRDELRAEPAVTDIRWRQIVAANAITVADAPGTAHAAGRLRFKSLQSVEWDFGRLDSDVRTHEFHVVASRSGVTQFPAPEAFIDGEWQSVAVDGNWQVVAGSD